MCKKTLVNNLQQEKRLERLLLYVEGIVRQIEVMDRFGIVLASLEACETISGVMVEQAEIINALGNSKDRELRKWVEEKPKKDGRFYSGHFVAIRDMMRLSKMTNELVEMKNDLVQDECVGWEELCATQTASR